MFHLQLYYRRFPGLHPHPFSFPQPMQPGALTDEALALFDRAKTMQLAGAGTYNQALKAPGLVIRWSSSTLPCHAMICDVGLTLKILTLTWYPAFRTKNFEHLELTKLDFVCTMFSFWYELVLLCCVAKTSVTKVTFNLPTRST